MRVLLIEANEAGKWVGGRSGRPGVHVVPLALLGLASCVRSALPGTEVRVCESSLDAPTDAELTALLNDFRPDLVGLRAINFFREEARRIVRGVRRWNPSIPLVLGGPLPTALGARAFEWFPELEMAAVGEGEGILTGLVSRRRPPGDIPGLLLRSELREAGLEPAGGPTAGRKAPTAGIVADLDALPTPDYSLVDLDRYAGCLSYAYNQRRQGVLLTSRGCPYRCTYCFQPGDGKVRLRSAESVVREIEQLTQDHGIRDYYVVDDIFNVHRGRALRIFELLRRAKLGIRLYFVNGLRVELCDQEFVDRMLEAGTVWVAFAVESAHPRIAKMVKKEVDLAHAHRIISAVQSAMIAVNVNTMFGFPSETAAEAQVTLDWLGTLPHPSLLPYHFNLRGYHGCEIVEQAEAAGWDRDAFLETGFQSYNDLPRGSPTFSRREQIEHLIQYHERFGTKNEAHLRWSVEVLRKIEYTDREIVDLYSVLLNRPLAGLSELFRR